MRPLLLPALVCSTLLAAGYLRTAEGTRHPSPWGYRTWSFGALAYSDVLALHEDRGNARHALPYVRDRIEYPVLLGLAMWAPSVVRGDREGYFALTFALLAACALGTLWTLARLPGARPWAFAASPALLVYAGLNWDLLGILPFAGGLAAWGRGRHRLAVALLALAVATKLFPALALGLLLGAALRRSPREFLSLAALAAGVLAALNLPFALLAFDGWSWFFRYNASRPIEPSAWLLAGADPRAFSAQAGLGSGLAVLLAFALLGLRLLRGRPLALLPAICGLTCLFFALNKVFSPQYWLWVVAILAAAGAPVVLCASASAASLADFVASFSRLHLAGTAPAGVARWFDEHVFWPTVAIRCGVLGACALWGFRRALADREGAFVPGMTRPAVDATSAAPLARR